MTDDVSIDSGDASVAAHDLVDTGIGDFNDAAAPLAEVRPLACIARVGGEVIGGAVGRSWGACAELQQLWVREDRRGAGIGRRLLAAFETAAAARGAATCFLESFSFQAPAFYAAQGYATAWRNAAYPHSIVKHHMVKALGAVPPPL